MDPILDKYSKCLEKRSGVTTSVPRLATALLLLAAGFASANITERREAKYLQSRIKIRIGEGWKVTNTNPSGAEATSFNDASWSTTAVPHDMSIPLVATGNGNDPGAKGWYRKHFTMPTGFAGKKVIVQFDGVYHDSKVYLNGHQVGGHEYGYVSFTCDLTQYLNPTGDNVLAVFVDNLTSRNSRWYSGTGIFRHVWLIATDMVHVQNWGTAVTTPGATSSQSDVTIQTEVVNETSSPVTRSLQTTICDSTGSKVQSVTTSITIPANKIDTVTQKITVTSPKLWSLNNPYVYNAYTQILNGTVVGDDYVTPFGIRDLQFQANKGMLINGVVTKMKGVCIHHTLVPVGAAVPDAMLERTIREIKASGSNSIRTSHAPMSPEFYDLCDRMGMLVMDEWCDKWYQTQSGNIYQDWNSQWQGDLRLFLIRDRNHPSVVVWSVGNEVDPAGTGKITSYTTGTLDQIVPFAKKIESTRPYTHACVAGWSSDWAGYANLAQHEDLIGVNYQDWQYSNIHNLANSALIVGTEQYPYVSGGYPTWPVVRDNAHVIGHHLWTGMDYLGEGNPLGSASGYLDNCAFRKTWFYYMKSQWRSDSMMVKLGTGSAELASSNAWSSPTLAEHWNQSGNVNVVAFTSGDQVDLYLNGNKIGTKYTKDNTANQVLQFTVPWASGTLKAVASKNGQQVATDSLVTAGSPTQLLLKPDRTTIYADGNDVSNIEVYIADAQGRPCRNATNSISYTVSGNGRGFGIGSGDWQNQSAFTNTSRKAYEGRVLIPIQSTTTPGSISVTITSNGLTAAPLTLTTVAEPAATTGIRQVDARTRTIPSSRLLGCVAQARALRIQYQLDAASPVDLSVVSPSGQILARLEGDAQEAGIHSQTWNGLPQHGVYLVSLKANGLESSRKVVMP